MNRFQRPAAGWKGSTENALDDIRHTYERVMWGRKTTGEVNMFPAEQVEEPDLRAPPELADPQEPDEPEVGEPEIGQDDDMDMD